MAFLGRVRWPQTRGEIHPNADVEPPATDYISNALKNNPPTDNVATDKLSSIHSSDLAKDGPSAWATSERASAGVDMGVSFRRA